MLIYSPYGRSATPVPYCVDVTATSPRASGVTALVRALVRASHPEPTVAVTAFSALLASTAGNDAGRCILMAAAVFTGQLSIGWSNDRIDADDDRQVGRANKPLANAGLSFRTTEWAIAVALIATTVLSLSLGWRAGSVHLAAVACGWLYNAWLKRSWWSWLPYAAAFGALPAVATLSLPGHPGPAAWVMLGGALLGIAANLTNALPDLVNDRLVDARGLPHRIGARPSLVLSVGLLVSATLCVVLGPRGPVTVLGWSGLSLTVAIVVAISPLLWRRPETRIPFYGLVALVPIDLVLLAVDGQHLH